MPHLTAAALDDDVDGLAFLKAILQPTAVVSEAPIVFARAEPEAGRTGCRDDLPRAPRQRPCVTWASHESEPGRGDLGAAA